MPLKLVILDRDGVINADSDNFIKSPAEWVPIPGSIEAIARLHRGGYRIAVATNQSGITRGLLDLEALTQIHEKMENVVRAAGGAIERVHFCPHGPDDGCFCRKPRPGMFERIGREMDCGLAGVPAIGDSQRDLQAAIAVGATPFLVKTGKGLRTLAAIGQALSSKTRVFDDLGSVADYLLAHRQT